MESLNGSGSGAMTYGYAYSAAGRVVQQGMALNNPPPGWVASNPYGYPVQLSYDWDSAGRMFQTRYPTYFPGGTLNLNYQYDNTGNLASMRLGGQPIATAAYGPAGEMTSLWTSYAGTETRTYNSLLQLTHEVLTTAPGTPPVTLKDIQYVYPTGSNNGRISESVDAITGEDVQYTYDSLQRLVAAQTAGPQWGDAYAYDGFGNLLSKTVTKGSAPGMSASYDPATNRPVGGNYDANGNAPIGIWDVENHLVSQNLDGQAVTWGYDPSGKRVMKYQVVNGQPNWTFWMYDIGGREILQVACTNGSCTTAGAKIYFGGRMIAATDPSGRLLASTDRLGSVRAVNTNGTWTEPSFFPYGEEKTPVASDGVVKFATYTRDSTLSNQDYADQRYYSNLLGRFYSPDRGAPSNARTIPANWNRYAYVGGDPINKTDPRGMCSPDDDPPCYSTTATGEADDEDDRDVAFQLSRGGSPVQQAIEWLALVNKRVTTATRSALRALDNPDCAKLFGIADPASLLSNLITSDTTVAPIRSPQGTTVSATTTPTTLVTSNGTFNGAEITINDVAGTFVTGTLNDEIVTLLHELGHAVNDIYGNGTSQIVSDGESLGPAGIQASIDNTALVKKNCLPVK